MRPAALAQIVDELYPEYNGKLLGGFDFIDV